MLQRAQVAADHLDHAARLVRPAAPFSALHAQLVSWVALMHAYGETHVTDSKGAIRQLLPHTLLLARLPLQTHSLTTKQPSTSASSAAIAAPPSALSLWEEALHTAHRRTGAKLMSAGPTSDAIEQWFARVLVRRTKRGISMKHPLL